MKARNLLVLSGLIALGCSHDGPPEILDPEQTAEVRIHRDEADLLELGMTYPLVAVVYDSGGACPERGVFGYRMGRQLGQVERLKKGESAVFTVPANRWIFLDLREGETRAALMPTCGLTTGWQPAPGHRYDVVFTTQSPSCEIRAHDTTAGESVAFYTPRECAEREEST